MILKYYEQPWKRRLYMSVMLVPVLLFNLKQASKEAFVSFWRAW